METKNSFIKNIRRGLLALSALLAVSLLAIFFVPTTDAIVLTGDQSVLTKIPIKNEIFFEVEFRHSVNRGLVIERYEVDTADSSLALITGWFESYGAGMMDTVGEGMKMSEDRGMLRIDFSPQKTSQVVYRSAGIAGHRILYGDKVFLVHERWGEQSIQISVGKMNLFERYLWYR